MSKLEFTPINNWQQFNFLGKRFFDFINSKSLIRTGSYVGDGVNNREIQLDIDAKIIIIFDTLNNNLPIIWINSFPASLSKQFDGVGIINGILGMNRRKTAFMIGTNALVNGNGTVFAYIALGD